MEAVSTFAGLATLTLGSALLAVLLDWLCLRGLFRFLPVAARWISSDRDAARPSSAARGLAAANELSLPKNRGGDQGGGKPCYS